MDKHDPFSRKEMDDETPKKPDKSVSASSSHGSDETPKQSPQSNQTNQPGSSLPPLQESPYFEEDFPKLTSVIQSKKELRFSYLKDPKATHGSTPKQSPQINKTCPMDQISPRFRLQHSHLSDSITTHGSSPFVNMTSKSDLTSLSKKTATQEPDLPSASAGLQIRTIEKGQSSGSFLPRSRKRLPVFEQLCSGVEFPWFEIVTEKPDLPWSGKGTMSANSPCTLTPKASAEPFTLSPSSQPRQASQQPSCDNQNLQFPGDDSRTFEAEYPKPSREVQSKKKLRNAHLKTPTATLSTTTTHGSTPSVDVQGTETQERDMSSASDDKRQDDEITGQDQDDSALDDKLQ